MDFWKQREVTEKLIAKRKALKREKQTSFSRQPSQWLKNEQYQARPLDWMDRVQPVWTGIPNTYGGQQCPTGPTSAHT